MTKKNRDYRVWARKVRSATRKFASKVSTQLWEHGLAGSWVGLNKDGEVEIRVLTKAECQTWMDKLKSGEPLPQNISITDGERLYSGQ